MIFTGFKRKTNQKFFDKKVQETGVVSHVERPVEIKKIIVFLDELDRKEAITEQLQKQFDLKLVNVEFVIFKEGKEKGNASIELIIPKDFGWYGSIKSDRIKEILTNKYDLLINYSKVDNLYLNLLILQCKAGFKVGFDHLDHRLHDLLISCKSDELAVFHKELVKYLKIINIG